MKPATPVTSTVRPLRSMFVGNICLTKYLNKAGCRETPEFPVHFY